MRKALAFAICCAAVLVFSDAAAPARDNAWDRIDIYCVVRDAQGRAVTNLAKDRFQVFEAGTPRPIRQMARADAPPIVVHITSSENLYSDAYEILWRTFDRRPVRKILVVSALAGAPPAALTTVRRWELDFFAESRGSMIYVVGDPGRLAHTELVALAEETGGRVVASERDVQDDLAAQYHIVADPSPHGGSRIAAGVFHTLEVRVAGANVQAPRSFYLTPIWH